MSTLLSVVAPGVSTSAWLMVPVPVLAARAAVRNGAAAAMRAGSVIATPKPEIAVRVG